jgi:hypothetical protein
MNYAQSEGGIFMPEQALLVGGKFIGTLIRDGKVIDEFEDCNLVVNEGLNALNDIMFHGTTQITQWYLGVFEANYTPVSTVTAATITAASTECTAYASSTRPTYDEAASASQVTTNAASRASFVFNATKTIYGGFLVSASAKSATTGTLFAAAQFSSAKSVVSGDELLLTYAFTSSSV